MELEDPTYKPRFPKKYLNVKSFFRHALSDEQLRKNNIGEWYSYSRIGSNGVLSWCWGHKDSDMRIMEQSYSKMMKEESK